MNVELCVNAVKPGRSQCKAGMEQSHSEDKENTLKHKDALCALNIHLQGTRMNVPFLGYIRASLL